MEPPHFTDVKIQWNIWVPAQSPQLKPGFSAGESNDKGFLPSCLKIVPVPIISDYNKFNFKNNKFVVRLKGSWAAINKYSCLFSWARSSKLLGDTVLPGMHFSFRTEVSSGRIFLQASQCKKSEAVSTVSLNPAAQWQFILETTLQNMTKNRKADFAYFHSLMLASWPCPQWSGLATG